MMAREMAKWLWLAVIAWVTLKRLLGGLIARARYVL